MNVGDEFDLIIKRGGQEIELRGILFQTRDDVFEAIEEPSPNRNS